jgi:hypothetical protein
MTLIMRGRETRDVIKGRMGGKAKQILESRVEGSASHHQLNLVD